MNSLKSKRKKREKEKLQSYENTERFFKLAPVMENKAEAILQYM